MALGIADGTDRRRHRLYERSMLGEPVAIKRLVGYVVPFSQAIKGVSHLAVNSKGSPRRAMGMASPPGLEPGITA